MEAGGLEWSEESQAVAAGESVGLTFPDLDIARLRYLGGSSGHWNGLCRAARRRPTSLPAPGESRTPAGRSARADLDPYADEVHDILDLVPIDDGGRGAETVGPRPASAGSTTSAAPRPASARSISTSSTAAPDDRARAPRQPRRPAARRRARPRSPARSSRATPPTTPASPSTARAYCALLRRHRERPAAAELHRARCPRASATRTTWSAATSTTTRARRRRSAR